MNWDQHLLFPTRVITAQSNDEEMIADLAAMFTGDDQFRDPHFVDKSDTDNLLDRADRHPVLNRLKDFMWKGMLAWLDAEVTAATGFAERDCATKMLKRLPKSKRRRTVAGDKNYDTKKFVADVREAGFTPHVAQNNTNRRSAIDGRTTRHAGYTVSQRIRKRVEEPFGWIKTVGAGRKVRYIGNDRNRAWFKIEAAVYNLIRITALDAATA